jgi:hypothetical protein
MPEMVVLLKALMARGEADEAGCFEALRVGGANVVTGGSWSNAIASIVYHPDLRFLGPMLEGTLESVASDS